MYIDQDTSPPLVFYIEEISRDEITRVARERAACARFVVRKKSANGERKGPKRDTTCQRDEECHTTKKKEKNVRMCDQTRRHARKKRENTSTAGNGRRKRERDHREGERERGKRERGNRGRQGIGGEMGR